ncbi:MAG TPA: anti-sigma factor [Actinomycetota bacterium]|nr:anti-sigma factor [Actinomycetota bacterium]
MRRCHEIRLDLPAYLSAELDSDRATALDEHLAECGGCLAELSELDLVTTALSRSGLEHRPPVHLEREVLTLVTLEPDPAGREGEVRDLARASRLQGKSIKVVIAPVLATTAVILAALGIAWRADLDDARDRIRAMQQQLGPTGATVQEISFEDAGVGEASARGELVRQPDGNHRIVLWAEGLRHTSENYHYEVWLSGEGGKGWVSAGSFKVSEGDSLVWSCPVGVSPENYPEVWVTIEPDDGNPKPTSRTVLQASL